MLHGDRLGLGEILAFGVLGKFAEHHLVEVDSRGEDSVPRQELESSETALAGVTGMRRDARCMTRPPCGASVTSSGRDVATISN